MSEVLLRDLVEADLEVLYEQQREEEAVRRAQFPARDREPFMTHWRTKVLADPANHVQIVVAGGEVAGSFMAWWRDDRRFIGYWLGQRFWGRGIGTAALRQFLQREQIRPLYADPFIGNTASVRLLERCGFRRVGTDHEGDLEFAVLMLADSVPPLLPHVYCYRRQGEDREQQEQRIEPVQYDQDRNGADHLTDEQLLQ